MTCAASALSVWLDRRWSCPTSGGGILAQVSCPSGSITDAKKQSKHVYLHTVELGAGAGDEQPVVIGGAWQRWMEVQLRRWRGMKVDRFGCKAGNGARLSAATHKLGGSSQAMLPVRSGFHAARFRRRPPLQRDCLCTGFGSAESVHGFARYPSLSAARGIRSWRVRNGTGGGRGAATSLRTAAQVIRL